MDNLGNPNLEIPFVEHRGVFSSSELVVINVNKREPYPTCNEKHQVEVIFCFGKVKLTNHHFENHMDDLEVHKFFRGLECSQLKCKCSVDEIKWWLKLSKCIIYGRHILSLNSEEGDVVCSSDIWTCRRFDVCGLPTNVCSTVDKISGVKIPRFYVVIFGCYGLHSFWKYLRTLISIVKKLEKNIIPY